MAKMNEPKVIAFADFETSNSNDIKEETGCDVRIVGNEAHMFDTEGKDMGFPRVRVKCAGILVRFQDGSRNGGVFESIEEMLGKVLEWRVDRMYFHNLRFDDSFIGSLIQDGKLDLGNASKLESIGKDFGVSKFVTPENEALRTGCDVRMKAYCIRDCLVLMTAMEYYFEKCNRLDDGRIHSVPSLYVMGGGEQGRETEEAHVPAVQLTERFPRMAQGGVQGCHAVIGP